MKPSLLFYSKRNYSGLLFLGGLVILSFAPTHWRAGETLITALITGLGLSIWGLAIWALADYRLGSRPLMLVTTLCNFACLLLLVHLREIGVYWFYPLLIAVAFVMPWRWSIPLNAVTTAVALYFAASWMPEHLFIRLGATLFAVLIFAALFSYNLTQYQEMLRDLAVHDPLTGAFNRRYFGQRLDETRRHWKRTGRSASMLILDIDHFKQINDRFGHATGDAVLVALTEDISSQLRPMDRFFRLGGEEFAILLPETPAAQGAILAERIRQRIAAGPLKKNLPAFTVSFGVADYPEPGDSDWPEQCDAALYAAKAAGRNRVILAEQIPTEPVPPTQES